MASPLIDNIKPRVKPKGHGGWQGTALIVEALILLVVVVACLAVFVRLFSYAFSSNQYDQKRAHAIILASNQAERLAADENLADGVYTETTEDGYTVICTIESADAARGVLYSATISVNHNTTSLYTLETAHYVSTAPDDLPAETKDAEGKSAKGGE